MTLRPAGGSYLRGLERDQ